MNRLHCDGCGKTVPVDEKEKIEHDILEVTLSVLPADQRDWVRARETDIHKADLCGECRRQVLSTFFRVVGKPGELPTFLLPPATPAIR